MPGGASEWQVVAHGAAAAASTAAAAGDGHLQGGVKTSTKIFDFWHLPANSLNMHYAPFEACQAHTHTNTHTDTGA